MIISTFINRPVTFMLMALVLSGMVLLTACNEAETENESVVEVTAAHDDLLVNIRGYYRFRDGDNRQLPVKVDVQKES